MYQMEKDFANSMCRHVPNGERNESHQLTCGGPGLQPIATSATNSLCDAWPLHEKGLECDMTMHHVIRAVKLLHSDGQPVILLLIVARKSGHLESLSWTPLETSTLSKAPKPMSCRKDGRVK